MQAHSEGLAARIKQTIGITARVFIYPTGSMERSMTGKARRVVDKRPKE